MSMKRGNAMDLSGAALDVLAAGCDVCMVRPVSLHELWAEVAEALQREPRPGGYPLSQMRSLAREVLQSEEA